MGANTFIETGIGKSAREAFDSLVREAQHEYGHDPYSGTIATKAGHGAVSLESILAPFSAARREVISCAALSAQKHDPEFDGKPVNKRGSWFRWVEVPGYGTWGMNKDVKPAERAAVVRIAREIDDKWGPAAYYEITGKAATEFKQRLASRGFKTRGYKVYRFLGWAAS